MSKVDHKELREKINAALLNAEKHWSNGEELLIKKLDLEDKHYHLESLARSTIPGHPWVSNGETIVDEFVALVLDMRDSGKHLEQAISNGALVSQLERVYLETSALLAASSYTIEKHSGKVTEYLGDGLLALFQVNKDSIKDTLYAAHNAGKAIIETALPIVNEVLADRYKLPPLKVGVGLARSKALVTLVGYEENYQAKVVGECIYRATKLSSGDNEVLIDKVMKQSWPSSIGGKMKFIEISKGPVKGYQSKTTP